MQITELPPTRLELPGRADPVYLATQRWALESWEGEDRPDLKPQWANKYKFSVNGNRSCAELAIVHYLRDEGWHGVWVCPFGPPRLRSEWFPHPGVKTITQAGAPMWAVEILTACAPRTAGGSAASSTCSLGGILAKSDSMK